MLKSLFSPGKNLRFSARIFPFILAVIRLMAVLIVGWLFLDDMLQKLYLALYRLQMALR